MADSPAAVQAANANVPVRDGGPITWEELFPESQQPTTAANSTGNAATSQAAQSTQVTGQEPTTAQQNAAAFEIRTSTGTVYKSLEEAIKGIEHKDNLLKQHRQREILERGIDPLTGRQVQLVEQQAQPYNYMQDGKRYVEDLTSAAQKGDANAIWQAQTKLIYDAIAPAVPMMTAFAKQQAVDTVSSEIKDFREFYNSDNYKQALEEAPDLKDAISRAENQFEYAPRLAGLYKVAYRVSQGLRLPELLKAQPVATAAQPVRQTTAPATLAPATSTDSNITATMQSKEGRRAIIERFESQGHADRPLV